MGLCFYLTAALLAVPPSLSATSSKTKKIAVLTLRNDTELKATQVAYLTEQIRATALRLPAAKYTVMTAENMMEMLPPGTDDLAACEGDCEVETGRNIGADYVVTGSLVRFGQTYKTFLKLHDTKTARLLTTAKASARSIDAFEKRLERAAYRLMRPLRTASSAGIKKATSSPRWAKIQFDANVPGAYVQLDGKAQCKTPCTKRVRIGPYRVTMGARHYVKKTREVVLEPGRVIKFTLKKSVGVLRVRASPGGQPISVERDDGRRKYRKTTPATLRLKPGQYTVVVGDDRCQIAETKTVRIRRGKATTLNVDLNPKKTDLQVHLHDGAGTALAGSVWLDGVRVGRTAEPITVPVCADLIEVRHPSFGSKTAPIQLTADEDNEVLVSSGIRPPTAAERLASRRPAGPPPKEGSYLTASLWATASIGLGAIGYLGWTRGEAIFQSLKDDGCDLARACSEERVRKAVLHGRVMDAMMVTGYLFSGISALAAGYHYWKAKTYHQYYGQRLPPSRVTKERRMTVGITPVGPHGTTVFLEGAF
ncbi:MAG: PEGA domain-containing protein [Myxococcota bacterium]|nr:PEGA domain-containing protein [Myxococcota bacterium]